MRQFRPQNSVQPGSGQGAHDSDDHHSDTIPYEREERPGTSSCKRPPEAEDCAPNSVARGIAGIFMLRLADVRQAD
jgi:hypothetical protein